MSSGPAPRNGAREIRACVEKQGLELFKGKGKCAACHNGPLLSSAAVPPRQRKELIENMVMGDGQPALYDGGFYNIGVRPTFEDPGVGDNIGGPLSFSRQLVSGNRLDNFPNPEGGSLPRIAVDGAFKTPTLRNIGLTAPGWCMDQGRGRNNSNPV